MNDREEIKASKRLIKNLTRRRRNLLPTSPNFDDSFIYVSGKRKKKLEDVPAPLVKVTLLGKPTPAPGDEYSFNCPSLSKSSRHIITDAETIAKGLDRPKNGRRLDRMLPGARRPNAKPASPTARGWSLSVSRV